MDHCVFDGCVKSIFDDVVRRHALSVGNDNITSICCGILTFDRRLLEFMFE